MKGETIKPVFIEKTMTANELADELEKFWQPFRTENKNVFDQAATMLRQLQTENKELHAIAQRMAMAESDARKSLQNIKDHPLELTDEEIMDIKTLMEINYGCVPPLEFAWAILRKASEK